MRKNLDLAQLLLRLTLGGVIGAHGVDKLHAGTAALESTLAVAGVPPVLAHLVYVGELLAPLMLVGGVFVRQAALIVMVNVAVAFGLALSEFLRLQGTERLSQFFELTPWNGELHLFMLACAGAVYFLGTGRYSLLPFSDIGTLTLLGRAPKA